MAAAVESRSTFRNFPRHDGSFAGLAKNRPLRRCFLENDPEPKAWGWSWEQTNVGATPILRYAMGPITSAGDPRGYRCNVCVVVARIRRPMNIAKDAGPPSE